MKGIYSIRDLRVGYLSPLVDENDSSASRNFAHAIGQPGTLYYSNPEDYELYRVGSFDEESGELIPEEKKFLCSAIDFRKEV